MTRLVSFVSSGPGDPELLTLKAVDRLKRADAVLFDDLSSGPILSYVRSGADLVAVGKRAGRPSPKQDHVSRLLVDYAQQDQHVVRLKSGDSGIFGRLEEEITALREAGIPYEIIPGIPSAIAAAAAAGFEVTCVKRYGCLAYVFAGFPDHLGILRFIPGNTLLTRLFIRLDRMICAIPGLSLLGFHVVVVARPKP
mgnify:CR=1 FL=1